jgi:hypothetical protein
LTKEIRVNSEKLNNDTEKIAADITINALKQFQVKCLNGLGGIYFAIQDRELANYFFYKALELLPNDPLYSKQSNTISFYPDINNQVGVVYTELNSINQK